MFPLTILGITLVLWETVFLVVLALMLIGACAVDNRGDPGAKWFITIVGIGVFIGVSKWQGWTLGESLAQVEWWKLVIGYIACGLVFSVINFFVQSYKGARDLKDLWQDFLLEYANWFISDKRDNRESPEFTIRKYHNRCDEVPPYLLINSSNVDHGVLGKPIEPNDLRMNVTIIKSKLAAFIGAWTLWFPFYALALVFEDMLLKFFDWIASLFSGMFTDLVNKMFNSVTR
jgi:hypothetical protein